MEENNFSQELLDLRNEAQGLRLAIEARNKQKELETENRPVNRSELEEVAQNLENEIISISNQIESIDVILDQISGKMSDSSDDTVPIMIRGLAEELKNTKKELLAAMDNLSVMKDFNAKVDSMEKTIKKLETDINTKLDDKAEKKNFIPVHQRLTTMFIVSVAGMIGSVMTLGLLSYLIYSIAK